MRGFLTVLLILLMVATLATLLIGMIGMVRESGDPMRSNRLMRWRVMLQAGALVVLALLMLMLRG